GLDIGAQVLPGSRPDAGDLYGFEVDFTVLEGAARLQAVFFGAAADSGVQDQHRVLYGASAGLRFPVVGLGPVRMTLEGRWRTLSIDNRDGLELGATIGWRRSRSAVSRPDATGLYVPRGTTERLRSAGIP